MAATKISDIVVPSIFNPYLLERSVQMMELALGPIIMNNADLNELATRGGKLINMPFFDDLSGNDEVLSDSAALTPAAITTGQDIAALLQRGTAWGVNDLARSLSGEDPMRQIADLVANYWVRKRKTTLINTLNGVFADNVANDSSDMVTDVAAESIAATTAATRFSAANFIAAAATLGDHLQDIVGIAVHSSIYQDMLNQDLITFQKNSDGTLDMPRYMNRVVIVDDDCPSAAGTTDGLKYTCYLFGEGAIGFGEGGAPVPTETDRDSLAGEDYLITRTHYILHPRGIAFQSGSVAGTTPTNAELALAANWSRVYDRKNVRLAELIVNPDQ